MLIFSIAVVASVAALTTARRLARHPLFALVKDVAVAAFTLVRLAYLILRAAYRFISGEVRSWRLSRSSAS